MGSTYSQKVARLVGGIMIAGGLAGVFQLAASDKMGLSDWWIAAWVTTGVGVVFLIYGVWPEDKGKAAKARRDQIDKAAMRFVDLAQTYFQRFQDMNALAHSLRAVSAADPNGPQPGSQAVKLRDDMSQAHAAAQKARGKAHRALDQVRYASEPVAVTGQNLLSAVERYDLANHDNSVNSFARLKSDFQRAAREAAN